MFEFYKMKKNDDSMVVYLLIQYDISSFYNSPNIIKFTIFHLTHVMSHYFSRLCIISKTLKNLCIGRSMSFHRI